MRFSAAVCLLYTGGMPRVIAISYSPKADEPRPEDFYHRVPCASAALVVDRGIEGDRKGAAGGKRQLNVMSAEMLAGLRDEGFKTQPGEMGEQIVLEGIDIDCLAGGTRLRIGSSAIIEVEYPRTGCSRFERIQGKFKGLVRGRLGMMVRVVQSGQIGVGDPVEFEPAPIGR